MYLLKAVSPMIAGGQEAAKTSTKPWIWQTILPKTHLPVIKVQSVRGISSVAQRRSQTARAMMYMLVVDRSLAFLWTAAQTSIFPTRLKTKMTEQIDDSKTTTARFRSGREKLVMLETNHEYRCSASERSSARTFLIWQFSRMFPPFSTNWQPLWWLYISDYIS